MSTAMAVALLPLAASAVLGFYFLNHGVIDSYTDIAYRLHKQIAPIQALRLEMQEALVPVDEFLEDGAATHAAAYRTARSNIESHFADLATSLDTSSNFKSLLVRAREGWTVADKHALEILQAMGERGTPGLTRAVLAFHGEVTSAVDRLQTVYKQIDATLDEDFRVAELYYERTVWVIGIATGVSLLAILFSVTLVSRMLSSSVDRLVEGAAKIAEGDRDHRIEVTVPPELSRVANEFNLMIGRIRDTEEALERLARRDTLTGLPNRLEFDEALAEMQARIERHGVSWGVLTVDIDYFKSVNDTYGHAAGDEVLKAVSQAMASRLRPYDKLFRTGGEEFTILMPETDLDGALRVAERLRETVEALVVKCRNDDISVTISGGIAMATRNRFVSDVLNLADTALYQAKSNGRNQIVSENAQFSRKLAMA